MASEGVVLFKRGDEIDEDIWDDSALIAAYDRAVGTAKKMIKEKRHSSNSFDKSSDAGSGSDSTFSNDNIVNKHAHRGNKGKHSQPQNSHKWSVGDKCEAIYSGDGLLYEAKIISIDHESRTCTVSYIGYGNEEQICLDELHPIKEQKTHSRPENHYKDANGGLDHLSSELSSHKNSRLRNKKSHSHHRRSHSQTMPPSFSHPWSSSSMSIPPMGVPPPMPIPKDCAVDDEDAMASMLMAWYMCGYHSGYYQGRKEARKQSESMTFQ